MTELPHTVALVLNWRLPDVTLQCLRDLRTCGCAGLDVLVIDNGSGDGSAERFEREAEGAAVLALEQNIGYCAAINRGIAWARERGAELVLFLNNDMRLPPGFLR